MNNTETIKGLVMNEIVFRPIGIVRSPFNEVEGMPIQASGAKGIRGKVEIDPGLVEGLKDIEGFSHIIVTYYFHKCKGCSLMVTPFLDDDLHGVFATRVPRRPNAIGLSVLRLTGVKNNILEVEDVDILDRTPVLDIKPFVPEFDHRETEMTGWFKGRASNADRVRADGRFVSE